MLRNLFCPEMTNRQKLSHNYQILARKNWGDMLRKKVVFGRNSALAKMLGGYAPKAGRINPVFYPNNPVFYAFWGGICRNDRFFKPKLITFFRFFVGGYAPIFASYLPYLVLTLFFSLTGDAEIRVIQKQPDHLHAAYGILVSCQR